MTFAEPVTMLTDYALAGVCGYLAWRLCRQRESQVSRKLWVIGFSALGFAALIGGTHHGFAPHFSAALLAAGWKVTLYSVGIFNLAMLGGSIIAVTGGRVRRALLSVALLKFVAFAIWMTGHDEFRFAIADSAGAMLGLLLLHGWSSVTRRDSASGRVLGALALSALAAAVQHAGIAFHQHFNHNDLYHVIQIAAMIVFYGAGTRLLDRPSEPQAA